MKTVLRTRRAGSRAGFTALEAAISMTLMVMLVGTLNQMIRGMHVLSTNGDSTTRLQREAERALKRVTGELRLAGVVSVDGLDYPHTFVGGEPAEDYSIHTHAPAVKVAVPSSPAFGLNREIIFRLPADVDGDSVPDIGADGELVWSDFDVSFTVRTGADGINHLERRENGGAPRRLASLVERVTFETAADTGFAIPLDAVRVRIWFQERDRRDVLYTEFVETVVLLRNG